MVCRPRALGHDGALPRALHELRPHPEELRSGRPIIGIAQTGSDLSPCNRIHLDLARRVRDGIRDAGGIPMEFPVHPIFENCRRPTAALDRNLAYLGLVEILYGYPIDAVVLTTGCDKTTPAGVMAASTVDIPAIVLSGGPMLDGWHEGELVGSGTVIWRSRRQLAAGEIDEEEFLQRACSSAPSAGHCNTMGTASTMNAVAEALGLSLPGCAAIPAPYRERGQMAYATGRRIVEMAYEDLRPSRILTRESFLNALSWSAARAAPATRRCTSWPWRAMRASSCAAGLDRARLRPAAAAQHAARGPVPGRTLLPCRRRAGPDVGAAAGRPPAWRLPSVTGRHGREPAGPRDARPRGDPPFDQPLMHKAGFLVLSGNLFDFGILKTSVISEAFRQRYLQQPGQEASSRPAPWCSRAPTTTTRASTTRPEHRRGLHPGDARRRPHRLARLGRGGQHAAARRADPARHPPAHAGRRAPVGHGRQPLHPQRLARERGRRRPELAAKRRHAAHRPQRRALRCAGRARRDRAPPPRAARPPVPRSQSPWEALYREKTGQLADGATLDFALDFRRIAEHTPRHNH
jgi:dihydroxy-acid dehydratase